MPPLNHNNPHVNLLRSKFPSPWFDAWRFREHQEGSALVTLTSIWLAEVKPTNAAGWALVGVGGSFTEVSKIVQALPDPVPHSEIGA